MAERRSGPIALVAAFTLYFALFLTALAPFDYEFPLKGIEGGWLAASVYAVLHRFAYGTQFVFTNGPLFPLYHREFAGDLSLWFSLGRLAIVTWLAIAFTRLGEGAGRASLLLALLVFVIVWPTSPWYANDGLLILVPLFVSLLLLSRRSDFFLTLAGIVLTAAIGLSKVSLVTFALGAFLLADLSLLMRRRPPLVLITYVVASFGLFLLSGHAADQFIAFVVGGLEMTAGYTAALAKDGPWWELALFLLASALVAVVLVRAEHQTVREKIESASTAALRVLLVVGLVAFSLKAGFARHDSHSIAAWVALLFLTLALGLPGTLPQWRPRRALFAFAVPATLALAITIAMVALGGVRRDILGKAPDVLATQLVDAAAIIRDSGGWLATMQHQSDTANDALREWLPLPQLDGHVDSLSNIQSAIIAAGLDYWPHPTIQENMAFSPPLIARDRAFFSGPSAPDIVLFAPGDATDERHPASIEGSLWPLLLTDYAIDGEASGQLILKKRAIPREVAETTVVESTIHFGDDVDLPPAGALFLRLDIADTLTGKLATQLFKEPLIRIVLHYADGADETYRIVPGMIAEGMVIAPTIATPDAYRTLASGADLTGLRRPASFRLVTDGAWAYSPDIRLRITALGIPSG